MEKIRVLMIGPGEGVTGGISALVETIVPVLQGKVDLFYLPTVNRRPLRESGKFSVKNLVLAMNQFARFLFALFRSRPSIIHVHTSQGIAWVKDTFFVLVGKIYGCHVILHVHAPDFNELYGGRARFIQSYSRYIMRLADAVIAVSEEWKIRLAKIVITDRIHTFRNCVNVDTVLHHTSANGPTALFLGSIGPRKGAFDLLEAIGRLKSNGYSLRAWIAGYEERSGDLLKARTRCQELGLEDEYQLLGTVSGTEKADLLSKASMFVLPSYDEGLPMAVLEAMAAGLPIIATPVGGIPEVVRDNYNGFLITPGDVNALAEKLTRVTNDRQLRDIMGKRSRQIAEDELDVKPYVKRLVVLYESMTHK